MWQALADPGVMDCLWRFLLLPSLACVTAASRGTRDALRPVMLRLCACFAIGRSLVPPGKRLVRAPEEQAVYSTDFVASYGPSLAPHASGFVGINALSVFTYFQSPLTNDKTTILHIDPRDHTTGTYSFLIVGQPEQHGEYTGEPPGLALARAVLQNIIDGQPLPQ